MAQDRAESPNWQDSVAMNRYDYQARHSRFAQVMMATTHMGEDKAATLKGSQHISTTHPRQTTHGTGISTETSSASLSVAGMDSPSFAAASR